MVSWQQAAAAEAFEASVTLLFCFLPFLFSERLPRSRRTQEEKNPGFFSMLAARSIGRELDRVVGPGRMWVWAG